MKKARDLSRALREGISHVVHSHVPVANAGEVETAQPDRSAISRAISQMRSTENGLLTTQSTSALACSSGPTTSSQPVMTATGASLSSSRIARQFPTAHAGHSNVGEYGLEISSREFFKGLRRLLRSKHINPMKINKQFVSSLGAAR